MQKSRELKAQIVASSESDAGDLQQRWLEAADEYPSLCPPAAVRCPSCEQTPPSHHHHPPPRPPTSSRAWAGELDRHPIFTSTSAACSPPSSARYHRPVRHTSLASLTARFAPTPPSPLHPTRVLHRASALTQSPWRACTPTSTSRCPGHTGTMTASTSAGACWKTTRSCAK